VVLPSARIAHSMQALATAKAIPTKMNNIRLIFRKILYRYIWERIFVERISEPLHLNLISFFVAIFGSFRTKINFDLVLRSQHAYALLKSADYAKSLGVKSITVIEFGVAAGAGLLNICHVAKRVTALTGVDFKIVGFDTGRGMPPPESYRDHPDLYSQGDFPMNFEALNQRLPANASLIIGDIRTTLQTFLQQSTSESPIAFVSIDVDYYSSTRDAFLVFDGDSASYLPRVQIYLDDLEDMAHNSWCGELLAVGEFNLHHDMRKIERHTFLRGYRIFKNARWIDHMFQLHVLDHRVRNEIRHGSGPVVHSNPYL
jgi:hypothetical protein